MLRGYCIENLPFIDITNLGKCFESPRFLNRCNFFVVWKFDDKIEIRIRSRSNSSISGVFYYLGWTGWNLDNRLHWIGQLVRIFQKYWIFTFFEMLCLENVVTFCFLIWKQRIYSRISSRFVLSLITISETTRLGMFSYSVFFF